MKQQLALRYFSGIAPNVNSPPPDQHTPIVDNVARPGSETDEMEKKDISDGQKVAEAVEAAAQKSISKILEERFEHKQDIVERLGRVKEPNSEEIKENNLEGVRIPIISLNRYTKDILRGEEFFADYSMNDSKVGPGDPIEYLYVQGKEEYVQKVMSVNDLYLQDAEERWKRDLQDMESNPSKESSSQGKISTKHERSLPSQTIVSKESVTVNKTTSWTSMAKEKIKQAKESVQNRSKEQPKEDPQEKHPPPMGM